MGARQVAIRPSVVQSLVFGLLALAPYSVAADLVEIVDWNQGFARGAGRLSVHHLTDLVEYRGDLILTGKLLFDAGPEGAQADWGYGVVALRDGLIHSLLPDRPLFTNSDWIRAVRARADILYFGGEFRFAAGDTVSNVFGLNPIASDRIDDLGGGVPFVPGALGFFGDSLVCGPELRLRAAGTDLLWLWNGTKWGQVPLPDGIELAAIRSILEWQGKLWVGGMFLASGESPQQGRSIACWDGSTWSWPGDALRSDSPALDEGLPNGLQGVCDLAVFGHELYAAGSFRNGLTGTWGVARWNGLAWQPLPVRQADLRRLVVWNDALVAIGRAEFELADGSTTSSFCAWNGTQWTSLGRLEAPVVSPPFLSTAATVYEGKLVVGDETPHAEEAPDFHAPLTYDGSKWQDVWDLSGANGAVSAILPDGEGAILAGGFEFVGGIYSPLAARWTGTEFESMSTGMTASAWANNGDQPASLVHFDAEPILAGSFGLHGLGTQNIGRWDGARWQPLADGLQLGGDPVSFAGCMLEYEGRLLVGGRFDRSGQLPLLGLGAWDGSQWAAWPQPFQPRWGAGGELLLPTVWSLALWNGQLWIGGAELSTDGVEAFDLARWENGQWVPEPTSAVAVLEIVPAGDHLLVDLLIGVFPNRKRQMAIVRPGDVEPIGIQPPWTDLPSLRGGARVGEELWILESSNGVYRHIGNEFEAIPELPYPNILALAAQRDRLYVGGNFAGKPEDVVPAHNFGIATLSQSVPVLQLSLRAVQSADAILLHCAWPGGAAPEQVALERQYADTAWRTVEVRRTNLADSEITFSDRDLSQRLRAYRAVATFAGGRVTSDAIEFAPNQSGTDLPQHSFLRGVQPNPFNPATQVAFVLARAGEVVIEIFRPDGRRIRRVELGSLSSGSQAWRWDGTDGEGKPVASGSYVLRIQTPDRNLGARALLLK